MSGVTRRTALVGLAGGIAGLAGCGGSVQLGGGGAMHGSFLGETPPSLEAGGPWLNADKPLTVASLAGSVVWLEFSFMH